MKDAIACMFLLTATTTILFAQRTEKQTEQVQLYTAYDPCKGTCGGGEWSATEYEVTLRVSPMGPGYPLPLNAPADEGCTTTIKYRIIECSGENQSPKRSVIQITAVCTTCPGSVAYAIKDAVLRLLAKDNPGGLLRTTDGRQSISFSLPGCWSEYTCREGWTTNYKYCALPCAIPGSYMSNTRTGCCVYTFEIARVNCDNTVLTFEKADFNQASSTCENNVKPALGDCLSPPASDWDGVLSTCKSMCLQITEEDVAGINAEYGEYP